ncbi:calcium-transporting ATPase [Verticillium alfalfae VaMs.102]|uniref:Calcium-transporting ATPase n=1 Tax=Verticillium alfalfae (strain VaMs.102 / ATCC MYA-4576 / FGSC 10136) TaxID=526221 RepID=C9SAQ4_VERA1|nr:calcium-transporting ATPase [Verticillium alfalfae VaMs.102]EEY16343.1 calcium-transporting ATPase [Verticillium alfalfae VaMs.102]
MDPSQNKSPAPERIRWDDDEEAGKKARPTLRRGLSTESLAVHSIRSRRNSIDVAAALPVQYRTVSIDIDDYNKQQGQQKKVNAATTEVAQLDWHTLSPEEILRRLSSSRTEGLSPNQVARRMAHYGKNAPSDPPTHHTRKFLGYFFKGFGPILLVAAILVFIAWRPLGKPPAPANLALAIVLLAVFFIQAAFNMWQDWSSSRVMASIKTMLPDHCLVTRDGAQLTLLAEEIVPGDILTIKMGNKLPADVRFIGASSDARFDRSILTDIRASWLRRDYPDWINVPNLIISCVSVAVAFIPEGLPVAVTASMTISANMMRKNKILCKSLKTVESLGSVSVICSDKTGTLTQNKMTVIDCALGNERMSVKQAHDALVLNQAQNPSGTHNALDQLRSLAGLCNAAEFDAATRRLPVEQRTIYGDATDQAILRFSEQLGSVAELRRCWQTKYELAFNSKNKYMIRALGLVHPDGKSMSLPSDTAAVFEPADILLTIKGAPEILLQRATHYVSPTGCVRDLDQAARASLETTKDQWSAQGRRVILLARKVVSRSTLGSEMSPSFEAGINEQAKSGLTVVGLVGIVDPPRVEIPDVVETLRGAGVRIFMVTGDFALTAQAIATECGIITYPPSQIDSVSALERVTTVDPSLKGAFVGSGGDEPNIPRNAIVLSGPDLITLNDAQWDQLTSYTEIVFARTTPEHKLRIVREFQARKQTVAMTGDGVNDAPSLRAADVGVAMGSGSDVAIEAADMVLLDDTFASIVEALRYGRMMFDNLKKTVAYLLPAGSFSEFWPVMANVLFGLPQILSSFLMIIICLFTDAAAAIALAYEAPEADVLVRKPRVPGKDRLVDWKLIAQAYGVVGMLETLASFAMAFWYLERNGIHFSDLWFSFGVLPDTIDKDFYAQKLNVASSIYFVNLVVMQWFNLLAVRTRRLSLFQHPPFFNASTRNIYLLPAVLFALGMALFWLYVPEFQRVVGTAVVPVEYWFLPMSFGLFVLGVDEARKYAVRTWPKGFFARTAW